MHQILTTETSKMAHTVYVHQQCNKTVTQVTNASILRAENHGSGGKRFHWNIGNSLLDMLPYPMTATFIFNAMKTTHLANKSHILWST